MPGLMSFMAGLIDKKPEIAAAPNVDATGETLKTIEGNQQNLQKLQGIAGGMNAFNQDQLLQMLRKALPGYDSLMSKTRGVVDSQLSGEIPQDVQDSIQRSSAAKALAGGYGGSGMGRNLQLRDLGLTSLDLTNKGLDSASRWLQMSKVSTPQLFDISSMFLTPSQRIGNEWQNQTSKFQRDMFSNQIDQQYSWQHQAAEGIREDSALINDIAKSAASSAVGGAMCWVARECFGEKNPEWELFKDWLLYDSPVWFFNLYANYGEAFAAFIKDKPILKRLIRGWMRARISGRAEYRRLEAI